MIARFILVAALALMAGPALADDFVLAASKSHKLQVVAEGGAAWCGTTLRLRMVLESDSPDRGNPAAQTEMMSRLKTPIATDCKAANAAQVIVVENGQVVGTYHGGVASNWGFAAVPSAPVIASAPTATPLPQASPPPAAPAVGAQPVAASPPQAEASSSQANVVAPPQVERINYYEALARWLRDNPALAQDESTIRLWAAHRYGREYNAVQNQEFKVQPVLQKARVDFSDFLEKPRGDMVLIITRAYIGSYDFDRRRFPTDQLGGQFSLNMPCCQSAKVPSGFSVKVQDMDVISSLPMAPSEAQAFVERRTRYGSVNRTIYLALQVRLDKAGFKSDGWGGPTILGTVEAVTFYPDDDMVQPILTVPAAEFAQWRQARVLEREEIARQAAEREAEGRRQRLMAQRGDFINTLSRANTSVRLANFITDGDINLYRGLDNARDARAAALLSGKPIQVAMMVQSSGNGRSAVATTWPGKLELNLTESLPSLTSSQWYLVRGLLSVPEGSGVTTAQLAVQSVHACLQVQCADAADPAAIVDHKLAGVP